VGELSCYVCDSILHGFAEVLSVEVDGTVPRFSHQWQRHAAAETNHITIDAVRHQTVLREPRQQVNQISLAVQTNRHTGVRSGHELGGKPTEELLTGPTVDQLGTVRLR